MAQAYIYIYTTPPDSGQILTDDTSEEVLYAQADMLCTLHRLELSGTPVPGLREQAVTCAARLRRYIAAGNRVATAAWLTLLQDMTWPCNKNAVSLIGGLINDCETYEPPATVGCFHHAETLIRLCHYSPASTSVLQTRLSRLFTDWTSPSPSLSPVTALRRGWLLALWARALPGNSAALHAAQQILRRHARAALRQATPAAFIALHRLLCELDDSPHTTVATYLRPLLATPSTSPTLRAAAQAEILRSDVLTCIAKTEQDIEAAETA